MADMSLASVLVLNGPNLNLLGQREPEVYGSASLGDHMAVLRQRAESAGVSISDLQSNSEAELVTAVHNARGVHDAIIINAGRSPITRGLFTMRCDHSLAPSLKCIFPIPQLAKSFATSAFCQLWLTEQSPGLAETVMFSR